MEGVSTKVEVFSGVEIRSKITEWVRIHSCFLKSGYSDGHRNILMKKLKLILVKLKIEVHFFTKTHQKLRKNYTHFDFSYKNRHLHL